MKENYNIIKIFLVFLIICFSVSAFAEKKQNNLNETSDNNQKLKKKTKKIITKKRNIKRNKSISKKNME